MEHLVPAQVSARPAVHPEPRPVHLRAMPSFASLVNRCPPAVPFPDIARPLFIGLGASDVSGGHADQEESDAVGETTVIYTTRMPPPVAAGGCNRPIAEDAAGDRHDHLIAGSSATELRWYHPLAARRQGASREVASRPVTSTTTRSGRVSRPEARLKDELAASDATPPARGSLRWCRKRTIAKRHLPVPGVSCPEVDRPNPILIRMESSQREADGMVERYLARVADGGGGVTDEPPSLTAVGYAATTSVLSVTPSSTQEGRGGATTAPAVATSTQEAAGGATTAPAVAASTQEAAGGATTAPAVASSTSPGLARHGVRLPTSGRDDVLDQASAGGDGSGAAGGREADDAVVGGDHGSGGEADGLTGSGGDNVLDRTSGGCDARAFASLGVFDSVEDAKTAFNDQIDVVWASANFCDGPRERVGIDDVEWSHEVVNKAVIARGGWHMRRVQSLLGVKELRDVELDRLFKETAREGRRVGFFVDGILNTQYHRGSKPVRVKTAPATGGAARERHSTAVCGYEIFDHPAFILGGSMSASNLWLDARATPHRKKGYMRELMRVYAVYKCSSGERALPCTGKCFCANKRPRED